MTVAPKPQDQDQKTPKRKLSDKEIAARRANSRKSTGPKTPAGKARVRENAITHGAFARKVGHIARGPLAEDPSEVAAFRAAIIEDLDPQTAVQRALAEEIATVAWAQGRTERFTNLALSAVEPPRVGFAVLGPLADLDHCENLALGWRVTAAALANLDAPDLHWQVFEEVASSLWCNLPGGPATPGWDPDRGVRPASPDDWRVLIDRLIAMDWGTRAAAAEWAASRGAELEASLAPRREERAQLAARLAFTDGILDMAMNMSGRIRRDFIRLLERFEASKAAEEK